MRSLHTSAYLLLAILLITAICNAQTISKVDENNKNQEVIMSIVQNNKDAVRKIYEQALNKRNMKLLQDLISEDYVGIRGTKGVAAFEEPVASLIKAFSDIQWKIEELIGEGDKVFVRWSLNGTHTAQFTHFAATGKKISSNGMGIFEFKDGKVITTQVHTDRLGFLQQLGVLPLDLALPANDADKDRVRFIDKFLVPAKGKQEFLERVAVNRNFIKTLPGFIEDAAYERSDENGNLIFITIAVWESEDAVKKAKEAVQAEYKKEGFNMPAMLERLNITMDRGMYKSTHQP